MSDDKIDALIAIAKLAANPDLLAQLEQARNEVRAEQSKLADLKAQAAALAAEKERLERERQAIEFVTLRRTETGLLAEKLSAAAKDTTSAAPAGCVALDDGYLRGAMARIMEKFWND